MPRTWAEPFLVPCSSERCQSLSPPGTVCWRIQWTRPWA